MSNPQPNPIAAFTARMSLLTRALAPQRMSMANALPQEKQSRSCTVCTHSPEDAMNLVKPCRACDADYCKTCLSTMFEGATKDATRMPPRCCAFLQIHTAYLGDEVATRYRKRFEEWITRDKTYCPSPKCSAFVPERLLQVNTGEKAMSMQEVLLSVLEAVTKSPHSRFFRGELPITEQSGNTAVLTEYMDLAIVRERVTSGIYSSAVDMEPDMRLIVSNAKKIHPAGHPVVQTANLFLNTYLQALTTVLDNVHRVAAQGPPQDHFVCPQCHIAICMECKQIEHGDAPCDTTARDHELAMLEQFRYKRCPLCKHAVKKMYGCSHMQCICGAHWCYYCQKPIHECDGVCDERGEDSEDDEEAIDEDDDDEDEDEDEDEDDEEDLDGGDDDAEPESMIAVVGEHSPRDAGSPAAVIAADINKIPAPILAPQPPTQVHGIVNLDAGGARRWADAHMDFGDEPEENGVDQIWSCPHSLQPYKVREVKAGVNRGDGSKMECNKCFKTVRPQAADPASPASPASDGSTQLPPRNTGLFEIYMAAKNRGLEKQKALDDMAMECAWCYLVLCETCAKNLPPRKDSKW